MSICAHHAAQRAAKPRRTALVQESPKRPNTLASLRGHKRKKAAGM